MCGLIGIISHTTPGLSRAAVDAFEDLLHMDIIRGMDSTGVMGIAKDGKEAMLAKLAAPAPTLTKHADWDLFDQWAYQKARAIFGHNRAATRGAKTDENAHPFHEGKIVLMHNGTLNTWHSLKGDRTDITVDSHAIAHALNTRDTLDVLRNIDGAFALIWMDLEDKVIRIASNGARPLWFAHNDDVTMVASEYGMIGAAATRRNIKLKPDSGGYTFTSMKANTMLEFSVENFKDKPHLVEIPKKVYAVQTTTASPTQSSNSVLMPESNKEKKGGAGSNAGGREIYHALINNKVIFEVDDLEEGPGTQSWANGSTISADATLDGLDVRMFIPDTMVNRADVVVGCFVEAKVVNVDTSHTVYVSSREAIVLEMETVLAGPAFRPGTQSETKYRAVGGHTFSINDTFGWRHGTTCDMCGMDMEHIDYVSGYVELTQGGTDAVALVCNQCHNDRIC